jgi:hypothetical protein
MSNKDFIKLIEGFCTLAGIGQAEQVLRDKALMIDEVAFSLAHDDDIDPARFLIYVDFGPLPARRELEVCLSLMEANLFLKAQDGPVFAVSPARKNVTLVGSRRLADTGPDDLRNALVDFSAKARLWRKNYFIELKPAAAVAKRGVFHSLHLNAP